MVCTDLSGPMLAVGREQAAAAGVANLEFVEAGAELAEASFDAVLSRQGLQFLPDVAGRWPGCGRSWSQAGAWPPPSGARRPRSSSPPRCRSSGPSWPALAPPPRRDAGPVRPGRPRPAGRLAEAAGFAEVATGAVTATYRFASPSRPPVGCATSPRPSPPGRRPAPEVQERVWEQVSAAWAPFATPAGQVRLDNQALWVTGRRPLAVVDGGVPTQLGGGWWRASIWREVRTWSASTGTG